VKIAALVLLASVVVAASGCAGEARNAGCSELDHSFAKASVATASISFIGAETPDELDRAEGD
jgi:hypothetical protein